MSLVQAEVDISNMAIARIGGNRFTLANQAATTEGIQANLWYAHCRDGLLRVYDWNFARARATLTAHPDTPDFEWDYQYPLPDDFLRLRSDYSVDDTLAQTDRFTIEGNMLLSNEDAAEICYVKQVTDPAEFHALFKEMLIVTVALKMLFAIAGTSSVTLQIHLQLSRELDILTGKAKAISRSEVNVSGRSDWNNARLGTGLV